MLDDTETNGEDAHGLNVSRYAALSFHIGLRQVSIEKTADELVTHKAAHIDSVSEYGIELRLDIVERMHLSFGHLIKQVRPARNGNSQLAILEDAKLTRLNESIKGGKAQLGRGCYVGPRQDGVRDGDG